MGWAVSSLQRQAGSSTTWKCECEQERGVHNSDLAVETDHHRHHRELAEHTPIQTLEEETVTVLFEFLVFDALHFRSDVAARLNRTSLDSRHVVDR